MKIMKNLLLGTAILFSLIALVSCGGQKNDRVYQMSEIEGTYIYSTYKNGTSYDYILVIKNGYATATIESYTFEGDRYGMPHNVSNNFSGSVELTDKNIKIGQYVGYIKTDGGITITIKDITYKEK